MNAQKSEATSGEISAICNRITKVLLEVHSPRDREESDSAAEQVEQQKEDFKQAVKSRVRRNRTGV